MDLAHETLRAAAAADRIRWRYHALQRARQRGISRPHALHVVQHGDIVEGRPYAEPFPQLLVMAEVQPGEPLYVALAYDEAENSGLCPPNSNKGSVPFAEEV